MTALPPTPTSALVLRLEAALRRVSGRPFDVVGTATGALVTIDPCTVLDSLSLYTFAPWAGARGEAQWAIGAANLPRAVAQLEAYGTPAHRLAVGLALDEARRVCADAYGQAIARDPLGAVAAWLEAPSTDLAAACRRWARSLSLDQRDPPSERWHQCAVACAAAVQAVCWPCLTGPFSDRWTAPAAEECIR